MKTAILVAIGLIAVGCSSAPPKKVQTFGQAVQDNPDLDSGIYEKRNGEDVSVEVKSMRSAVEEAEKKAYEAQREANYLKLKQQEVEHENLLLRARGNYKLQKEVKTIQGFDNQNNPIIKTQQVNLEPEENELRYEQVPINSVRPRPSPTRIPASEDSQ